MEMSELGNVNSLTREMQDLDTEMLNSKSSNASKSLLNTLGITNLIFLVIPFLMVVALAMLKPSVIMKEVDDSNDKGKKIKKLNYMRLLGLTLILSLLFPVTYYGYFYYYKK